MNITKETKEEYNRRMQEVDALWVMFSELAEDEKSREIDLTAELDKLEKTRITEALAKANGNQTKAAKLLKIGRTCLIAKMRKFNLS